MLRAGQSYLQIEFIPLTSSYSLAFSGLDNKPDYQV